MPRIAGVATPKYRRHRASDQAVVTIAGQDHYLGPWKSKASRVEYDRLIGEWLAAGRPTAAIAKSSEMTIVELCAAYWDFAQRHYRNSRGTTGETHGVRSIIKRLRQWYGKTRTVEFGPLALKALRQRTIDEGLSRNAINQHVSRIRRIFRWAVSEEMLPVHIYQALATVAGLRKGYGEARESDPVMPVSDEIVDATLPHLPRVVADMVKLQRLTGARPGEIVLLRPADVDTSGPVWAFRPATHKTEHHVRERIVNIGPRAQAVLRPYLDRPADRYCFSPLESEQARRAEVHQRRKTPLHYGNRPGFSRTKKRKRVLSSRYNVSSYRRAIARACDIAFAMPRELQRGPADEQPEQRAERRKLAHQWRKKHCWAPNQLRHSLATAVRKEFGVEAAGVVLGHSRAIITLAYAERDQSKAQAVMTAVG